MARISAVDACVTLGMVLLLGTSAYAASDAQKCAAAKNKIAGKYDLCRQTAEAKAVKSGNGPDFSKCDASYAIKWPQAETNGNGMCPTSGDQVAMKSFISTQTTTIGIALTGVGLPTCGDNAIDVVGEQCDGIDLGGESCMTLGFNGGTLACSSCSFDTSGCTCGGGGLPKTGQTQCDQGDGTLGTCPGSPVGQDGAVQAGATRSFTDNGDGTITDNATGLMWEKLSSDGSIHDTANTYSWSAAFSTKIATLNSSAFGGHSDWRLPNISELLSLVDYGTDPPTLPAFSNSPNCHLGGGCTVTTCSCSSGNRHWSSSTLVNFPSTAWYMEAFFGESGHDYKIQPYAVRAVRGGL